MTDPKTPGFRLLHVLDDGIDLGLFGTDCRHVSCSFGDLPKAVQGHYSFDGVWPIFRTPEVHRTLSTKVPYNTTIGLNLRSIHVHMHHPL